MIDTAWMMSHENGLCCKAVKHDMHCYACCLPLFAAQLNEIASRSFWYRHCFYREVHGRGSMLNHHVNGNQLVHMLLLQADSCYSNDGCLPGTVSAALEHIHLPQNSWLHLVFEPSNHPVLLLLLSDSPDETCIQLWLMFLTHVPTASCCLALVQLHRV